MCATRKGYLTVWAGSGQAGCVCSASSPPGQGGAVAVLLDGLEGDADLDVVRERVGEFFAYGTPTSPRGLLELAASAFLACGASSVDPLVFDELEERYLPEWPVRGNAAHQKRLMESVVGVERRFSVCGSDRLTLEAPAACWLGWLSNEASTGQNRVAVWLERGVHQFHQECPPRRPNR